MPCTSGTTFVNQILAHRVDELNQEKCVSKKTCNLMSTCRYANKIRRPTLDKEAVEKQDSCPPSKWSCPPEIVRTPLWENSKMIPAGELHSLSANKFLLLDGKLVDDEDIGFRFSGQFTELGPLGHGSTADVFLARETHNQKIYAVSRHRAKFKGINDKNYHLKRLKCVQKVGESHCPYIVKVYQSWQENGYLFTQMEYCPRGCLRQFFVKIHSNASIVSATCWKIIHDVGEGLKHIHNCRIVHMDIKPENCLISTEGDIKIGDFGCCVQVGDRTDGGEGDAAYLALELLNRCAKHFSADIFSLGLMLYEICSQKPLPVGGQGWHDLREERAPPLSDKYDDNLTKLICKMIAKTAHQRPTAFDILNVHRAAEVELEMKTLFTQQSPHVNLNLFLPNS